MILAGPITLSGEELALILGVLALVAIGWFLLVLGTVRVGVSIGHALAGHVAPVRHARGAMAVAAVAAALLPLVSRPVLPPSLGLVGVAAPGVVAALALGGLIGWSGEGADRPDH
jgi:hypothetical protein